MSLAVIKCGANAVMHNDSDDNIVTFRDSFGQEFTIPLPLVEAREIGASIGRNLRITIELDDGPTQ